MLHLTRATLVLAVFTMRKIQMSIFDNIYHPQCKSRPQFGSTRVEPSSLAFLGVFWCQNELVGVGKGISIVVDPFPTHPSKFWLKSMVMKSRGIIRQNGPSKGFSQKNLTKIFFLNRREQHQPKFSCEFSPLRLVKIRITGAEI